MGKFKLIFGYLCFFFQHILYGHYFLWNQLFHIYIDSWWITDLTFLRWVIDFGILLHLPFDSDNLDEETGETWISLPSLGGTYIWNQCCSKTLLIYCSLITCCNLKRRFKASFSVPSSDVLSGLYQFSNLRFRPPNQLFGNGGVCHFIKNLF